MIEFMFERRFGCAVLFGVLLVILFVLALLAASIWRLAWNWVDEGEKPIERNQILAWLYRRAGYVKPEYSTCYQFMTKSGGFTDGLLAWFVPMAALLLGPLLIVTLLTLYQLALTLLTIYVVAHTARFARRTSKALNKHAADPHAHKEAK